MVEQVRGRDRGVVEGVGGKAGYGWASKGEGQGMVER